MMRETLELFFRQVSKKQNFDISQVNFLSSIGSLKNVVLMQITHSQKFGNTSFSFKMFGIKAVVWISDFF